MSHNVTTINAQAPARVGAVTQTLNNLSDVSASPSSNQMLTWGGSSWGATSDALTPSAARQTAGGTSSASTVLVATPNPYLTASDANRFFWEYAAKEISTTVMIEESTSSDFSTRVNTYGALTKWLIGFDVDTTGVYALRATLHVGTLSASSSYIDCSWTDLSYNKLGPITRFSTSANKRNTMRGIIDASAGDVAGVYIDAVSSAYYLQASYINIFMEVERVS